MKLKLNDLFKNPCTVKNVNIMGNDKSMAVYGLTLALKQTNSVHYEMLFSMKL